MFAGSLRCIRMRRCANMAKTWKIAKQRHHRLIPKRMPELSVENNRIARATRAALSDGGWRKILERGPAENGAGEQQSGGKVKAQIFVHDSRIELRYEIGRLGL